jgi:hypothetical protein
MKSYRGENLSAYDSHLGPRSDDQVYKAGGE